MKENTEPISVISFIRFKGTQAPPVAPVGMAHLWYDSASDQMKMSHNGIAFNQMMDGSHTGGIVPGAPAWTVGAEVAHVINVRAQLKDLLGANPIAAVAVNVWISDAAGGALAATPPTTSVAIGTNGTIINTYTAKESFLIVTNATGAFDLNVSNSTAKTFFMNFEWAGQIFSRTFIHGG